MSDMIAKSYNSIKELPSEVRSSFDERDQQKWMDAYNKASESKEPEQAKVDAWMSMVDAPSSLAVETWGSVEVRDADGELVPVKTIEEYADKFIENGGLMHDSHSNVPVGTVWDYEVRKHPETGQDGIVFYFNIYRDGEVFERARDDILSGRKNAVSIGAEAPRGGYKCDDRGCYVERDVTDLYELSICETPANPEAYFINVGKDIAKAKTPIEGEVFRIGIKDVVVHQDYTTCPLQKCKHDLLEKGFKNTHITDNGTVTAKSKKNEYKLFKAIHKMGYPFRYDLKKEQFEIMPDYGVEQAIEEAVENGWAHEDQVGHVCLTKEIPKEVFMDWYDRGFITKIGDFYCLKADDVAKNEVTKSGYQRPNGEQLYEMLSSIDITNAGPWMEFCERLTEITDEAMQRFNLDPVYEDIVRGFFFDAPGNTDNYLNDARDLQYMIDTKVLGKSAKKNVKKSADEGQYRISSPDGISVATYLGSVQFQSFNKDTIKKGIADVIDELFNHRGEYDTGAVAEYMDYIGLRDEFDEQKNDVFNGTRSPMTFIHENKARIVSSECDYLLSTQFTEYDGNEYPADEYNISARYIAYHRTPLYSVRYMRIIDSSTKSAKKKVKKDGGAMGVGDAGATNAVYGAKPASLTNPDKKYGKKKKTKKELTDDGNIHAVGSRQAKKSYGNFYDAVENFIVDSPEGVYYNDILDEFSDALDEDDILDALEQICSDGAIIYDDRTERFKVGKKVRKSE